MPDIAVAKLVVPTYIIPHPPGFQPRNLSTLACARGFTSWHYRATAETLEALMEPGYFDAAVDIFSVGDQVIISCASGGAVTFVTAICPHVVLSLPLAIPVPS